MNMILNDYDGHTDEYLAAASQEGDVDAFGALVDRYAEKLARYARRFLQGRHDTEDLTQDVFTKAFVNIKGFDPRRRFSSWLYRIAHNEFVDAMHRDRREALAIIELDTILPTLSAPPTQEDDEDLRILQERLDDGLAGLDVKYRAPLLLRYGEGMEYAEIAEIMGIPVSTVGVRISRGRELLKKTIRKDR